MQIFPILILSTSCFLQISAIPTLDLDFFEKKTEAQNAELLASCDVTMRTDMNEEGEALHICKYRNNYRESIENIEAFDETIDKCNTVLCTLTQNKCHMVGENSGNMDKSCDCLKNIWKQDNCTAAFAKAANDAVAAGLGNRVQVEDEEEASAHRAEEIQKALGALGSLSPDKYSPEQQKCFKEKKVLFNGTCVKLLDKKACRDGEWLVLKKPARQSDMIMPICKRNRCKSNEVYSTDLRRCLSTVDFKKRFCDFEGMIAVSDNYGDGFCVCAKNYEAFEDSAGCHELYQTGPCNADQVVTYNYFTGYAECTTDICLSENNKVIASHNRYYRKGPVRRARQSGDEISFHQEKKIYLPFNGVGPCYILGEASVCINDSNSRFVIDEETRLPGCKPFNALLYIIGGPSNCITDENNKCRNVVDVQDDNVLEYLLAIKNQKRRVRNSKG